VTVTITQNMQDIAGVPDNGVVWFSQAEDPREAADGSTLVTTRRVSAKPAGGVLTVELEPGPAVVELGGRRYPIEVPDMDGPLLPLILAGLPEAPAPGSEFVRNFGGLSGAKVVSDSWFSANPHDPTTLYVTLPD
jgi:hypothetical protein